ncbi:hypothetical protein NM208_g6774 [Fusarium decemcellulare]|uniref:Uncharacterized protein n=1 Tax=Fusarium decemcellulare TaxID=57161 RepID=A0ACC1SBS5_9HYPO|nr:hypothetical protein NM208_g6774 [Fusarium decemcellulare]
MWPPLSRPQQTTTDSFTPAVVATMTGAVFPDDRRTTCIISYRQKPSRSDRERGNIWSGQRGTDKTRRESRGSDIDVEGMSATKGCLIDSSRDTDNAMPIPDYAVCHYVDEPLPSLGPSEAELPPT